MTALKNLLPPSPHEYTIVVNTDNMTSQQVLSCGAGKDAVICTCAHQIWLIAMEKSTEVIVTQNQEKTWYSQMP